MANNWFSVSDERFLIFLDKLGKSVEEQNLPYMFFGGVAHQTHLASFLCKLHGRTLLDLATSDDIDLHRYLRSTDNIDIAFGLAEDDKCQKQIDALKKQDQEAIKRYKETIKMTLKSKKPKKIAEEEEKEQSRKSQLNESIIKLNESRKYYTDYNIRHALDSLTNAEFDSPISKDIITVKEIRRGFSKLQYTLGTYDEQDKDKPITVNLCREARDVSKNGWLKELEQEFYPNFLFRAQPITIPYTDETKIQLRVMNPEDILITKILMWRDQDAKDTLNLIKYAEESGNPVNYQSIEDVLCREREIVCKEDGKEKLIKRKNPVLCEQYHAFRNFERTIRNK